MQQSNKLRITPFFFFLFFLVTATATAQVGIGTTTPKPSAALEVSSTNKGFLPPQITRGQRDSIVKPAPGLMVWCTNCGPFGEIQVYNGIAWTNLIGGAASTQNSIIIGTQEWATKNLTVSAYRDGTPIPQLDDGDDWNSTTEGAWCWYNNDSATYATTYGKLYNWYAVTDLRGLAPAGWHLPTDVEWNTLSTFLGGTSVAGGKMKEPGFAHWINPNTAATNSSGYLALPGGYRDGGSFGGLSIQGEFWSNTSDNNGNASVRYMLYNSGNLTSNLLPYRTGVSVRCIKN